MSGPGCAELKPASPIQSTSCGLGEDGALTLAMHISVGGGGWHSVRSDILDSRAQVQQLEWRVRSEVVLLEC